MQNKPNLTGSIDPRPYWPALGFSSPPVVPPPTSTPLTGRWCDHGGTLTPSPIIIMAGCFLLRSGGLRGSRGLGLSLHWNWDSAWVGDDGDEPDAARAYKLPANHGRALGARAARG